MTMAAPISFRAAVSVMMLSSMISSVEAAYVGYCSIWSEAIMFAFLMLLTFVEVVDAADPSDGIRLPIFNKGMKFMVWYTRFEAFARLKKFWKVLVKTRPLHWPDNPTAVSATDAEAKELIEHNERAMFFLTMALNVESLSAMLRSALIQTVHYSMGIA